MMTLVTVVVMIEVLLETPVIKSVWDVIGNPKKCSCGQSTRACVLRTFLFNVSLYIKLSGNTKRGTTVPSQVSPVSTYLEVGLF